MIDIVVDTNSNSQVSSTKEEKKKEKTKRTERGNLAHESILKAIA
jgi:hypothetical protein